MINALVIAAHVIAAVVWVGGMFLAYVVVRPAMMEAQPPVRLALWAAVFKRFFPWVWLIVLVLLATGYWMVFNIFGGFASSPAYVHIMQLLGLLMMALFVYLYFVPYSVFKSCVAVENWPDAATALNRVRHVILVNLVLGLLTVAIASGGRYV